MTLEIHNWSSAAHQEVQKIVKDEIAPIVNLVDARVQNFEIQFLKEAAKFVRDFKSLAKEADESFAKHKALEYEIERLLRVVESEYAKLWNNWFKKCEECKYEKISYDKAYNDIKQKIKRLQAQLGDLKGKSMNTQCASNTLDSLSQKLDDENVALEFQVINLKREILHLKSTYQNLFDSIKRTQAQTKIKTESLQERLNDAIYEISKLREKLFDKFSEQHIGVKDTSVNTKFSKQSILGKPPSSSATKLYSVTPFLNSLSKSVTSHSGRHFMPNKHVKTSVRTKPITVSQPHVITKRDVNSNTNGFPSTRIESTAKNKRPQPRSTPKNDRIPYASKSSCLSNYLENVEDRNLKVSKTLNHRSSKGNNIKLAIRNDKYEVVCGTCKQCLITANHDEYVFKYVNDMNSSKKNQSANVSKSANQKK
ncbi:hypothetical protein Tco_1149741 [Tanacetum coccineum]